MTPSSTCTHFASIVPSDAPLTDVCEACLEVGDDWVHLRRSLTCGNVGCCDDSKNRHATKHFHATNHPIVKALEQAWLWCYIDKIFVKAHLSRPNT